MAQANQASKDEILIAVQQFKADWKKQGQPGLSDLGAAATGRTN